MAKNSNKKNKKDNKYDADNEIIIGVTTKPKEKVRVEKKKSTRTNTKPTQKKNTKVSNNAKSKNTLNEKSIQNKSVKNNKTVKVNVKNTKVNKGTKKQEITKEEKIKKINIKRIIISIGIVLFIALGGTIYYLTTPVFNISSIEVYGNEKNTVDTYISLSKINIGNTNIFAITENSIRKNIKENAYVEDVSLERKLPNTVQIYITERKVSYQIDYSGTYIFLDKQGHILELNEEKKDVPVVKGLSTIKGNIQVGQRLIEEDLIKLNTIAKFINYCEYNTIENKITSIDVEDSSNYIVKFAKDKKTVYLGDASNLSERLSMLKTILKNEKNKEIEIFMNGNVNEDDVYIKYVQD